MKISSVLLVSALVLTVFRPAISFSQSSGDRTLPGTMPAIVPQLSPIGSVSATQQLQLAIGLPLRNPEALTNLLEQLYDPASPRLHQWLTPEQFTAQFGPTEDDYAKVIRFAQAHGLAITRQHSNRLLLDVSGSTTNIEEAFQVKLRVFNHPTEKRTFYAPDKDPSIEADVPILHVSGLENFNRPRPLYVVANAQTGVTADQEGSGPGGLYTGKDFRAAYVPGVTNTGTGQYIAIVDVGGPYYTNDIYMYETNAGLSTSTPITNILLDGSTGIPSGTSADDGEEVLDIDMAMSMAPGATILNYEGGADDVFNQIAVDDKAKQMTLSYGFGLDANNYQSFQEFAAQGQSFSQASGDGGADLSGGTGLTGNPYATIVGGTALTTGNDGSPWESETAWSGSGGGISGYGVPSWQIGAANSTNQGSAVYRTYPDVAMLGEPETFIYFENGQTLDVGGTSESSPLWTGFMALVNQQAASQGNPSVGLINPAIYRIGKGPVSVYTNCFHDVTVGSNVNSQSPNQYVTAPGYDLCTGWGTPTGSNTIYALAGVGTNDFAIRAMPGGLTILRGGVATTTISVTPMNGLTGHANLSISGVPAGVGAVLSSSTVTSNCVLTFTVSNNANLGTSTPVMSGTWGSLQHSINLSLTVGLPIPNLTPVTLSYNRVGIYTDGRSFSGGLDGDGSAYSANLLGTAPVWNGVVFNLGPANSSDVVVAGGQTITLPAGNFTSLLFLATAVNGSQNSLTFTVTYSDGSTTNLTQNFSDWAYSQNFSGESVVASMAYRNSGGGSKDLGTPVSLYGYSLNLDQTRTVRSVTLPNDGNLLLLSMVLANDTASVSLASFYNRAGMYTDGTTFTNPATGGLDGIGSAYSASLLGQSLTWSNVLFNFGPANQTDVISAAGQVISLPPGNYSALRMLATGIEGNQTTQPFVVTYTNGSSTTFYQNLSDWFTPQNYSGQSPAVLMGHRNSSDGTKDNRTFYLYGYSFNLNSTGTVQSLRLPINDNVIVAAISLIPHWPPVFTSNPLIEPAIQAGQYFSGSMATNAVDMNNAALTFSKISGPSWLNVAANGSLSGIPLSANVGTNSFVVGAADPSGTSTNAAMLINVTAAPPIILAISMQANALSLNWTGGIPPYQIQICTNLVSPVWNDFGNLLDATSLTITPTNAATYYRVNGQ